MLLLLSFFLFKLVDDFNMIKLPCAVPPHHSLLAKVIMNV